MTANKGRWDPTLTRWTKYSIFSDFNSTLEIFISHVRYSEIIWQNLRKFVWIVRDFCFVRRKIINSRKQKSKFKFLEFIACCLPLCAFNMEWKFSMETRDICKIPTIYISAPGFMKGKYKKWDGGISQGGRGKRSATNIPVASPNNLEEPPLFAKTMHCGLTGSRELYKDPCSIA